MTKQDFLKRLLAVARAFKAADALAAEEDPMAAFNNTGILAGRFAKLVSLPTDERYWDMSGRCPIVNAIMMIAYLNNHFESHVAIEAAWQHMLASNSSPQESVPLAA